MGWGWVLESTKANGGGPGAPRPRGSVCGGETYIPPLHLQHGCSGCGYGGGNIGGGAASSHGLGSPRGSITSAHNPTTVVTNSTRLQPQQYLSAHIVGPGGRPCGGRGARRSSAPLLRSDSTPGGGCGGGCSGGMGGGSASDLRVPFVDALSPLTYDPYGPYSVFGLYGSTSLGGSPRASPRGGSPRGGSPRISPRSSPRRRSRVMSKELCLEDLVVVSVPCRERKVSQVGRRHC